MWDFFGGIRYINLADRPERRAETERQLAKFQIPAERFEGIRPMDKGKFPGIGIRGCVESHLALIRMARVFGWPNVLIFEDDIEILNDFRLKIELIISYLKTHPWDMFHFRTFQVRGKKCIEETVPLYQVASTLLTHAYVVNSTLYDKILSTDFNIALDHFYAKMIHPGSHILAADLIEQNQSLSDVSKGWRKMNPRPNEKE